MYHKWMDRHTNDQRDTIILRHYLVVGYKNGVANMTDNDSVMTHRTANCVYPIGLKAVKIFYFFVVIKHIFKNLLLQEFLELNCRGFLGIPV